jgi:hypothetical protein
MFLHALRTVVVGGLAALALVAGGPVRAMPTCGPGSDWVNSCSFDSFFDVFFELRIDLPDTLPYSGMIPEVHEVIGLSGTAHLRGLNPGGLDTVPIEIVSMSLTGISSVGPVVLSSTAGSGGQLVEVPLDPFRADSFFDVFVQIDLPALLPPGHSLATPFQPLTAGSSGATEFPSSSYGGGPQVPVYNCVTDQSGTSCGGIDGSSMQLLRMSITPQTTQIPAPGALALLGLGFLGLGALRNRRRR